MKLFYSAGSCSTSCHISLEESGLKYETVAVDWDQNSDPKVAEAKRLNPLGTLPVLLLDNGKTLDQNVAIHTYVADQAPGKQLLPPAGSFERIEAANWLSFISSDLHKSFSPLFALEGISSNEATRKEVRAWATQGVQQYLAYLDQKLAGRDYLMGKTFTVADSYCFVVAGWTKWVGIPLDPYKNVQSFLTRVYQRPAVQKVLAAEGLLE